MKKKILIGIVEDNEYKDLTGKRIFNGKCRIRTTKHGPGIPTDSLPWFTRIDPLCGRGYGSYLIPPINSLVYCFTDGDSSKDSCNFYYLGSVIVPTIPGVSPSVLNDKEQKFLANDGSSTPVGIRDNDDMILFQSPKGSQIQFNDFGAVYPTQSSLFLSTAVKDGITLQTITDSTLPLAGESFSTKDALRSTISIQADGISTVYDSFLPADNSTNNTSSGGVSGSASTSSDNVSDNASAEESVAPSVAKAAEGDKLVRNECGVLDEEKRKKDDKSKSLGDKFNDRCTQAYRSFINSGIDKLKTMGMSALVSLLPKDNLLVSLISIYGIAKANKLFKAISDRYMIPEQVNNTSNSSNGGQQGDGQQGGGQQGGSSQNVNQNSSGGSVENSSSGNTTGTTSQASDIKGDANPTSSGSSVAGSEAAVNDEATKEAAAVFADKSNVYLKVLELDRQKAIADAKANAEGPSSEGISAEEYYDVQMRDNSVLDNYSVARKKSYIKTDILGHDIQSMVFANTNDFPTDWLGLTSDLNSLLLPQSGGFLLSSTSDKQRSRFAHSTEYLEYKNIEYSDSIVDNPVAIHSSEADFSIHPTEGDFRLKLVDKSGLFPNTTVTPVEEVPDNGNHAAWLDFNLNQETQNPSIVQSFVSLGSSSLSQPKVLTSGENEAELRLFSSISGIVSDDDVAEYSEASRAVLSADSIDTAGVRHSSSVDLSDSQNRLSFFDGFIQADLIQNSDDMYLSFKQDSDNKSVISLSGAEISLSVNSNVNLVVAKDKVSIGFGSSDVTPTFIVENGKVTVNGNLIVSGGESGNISATRVTADYIKSNGKIDATSIGGISSCVLAGSHS